VGQEESEIKWGGLLGVVALTTNQPYFSSAIATGELQLTQPPRCRLAVQFPPLLVPAGPCVAAVLGCYWFSG
jgi:hypothetical protein